MEIKCNYSELVEIKTLKPHPQNNNKHPKDQLERLAKIIDYQGMRSPVVVSKLSGFIVKGHARLEALKILGEKEAPVEFQEYENKEQELADLTADNEIARWSELDLKLLNDSLKELNLEDIAMLGIKDFEVLEEEKPKGDENYIPELPDPVSKLGDVWLLGNHRILCGDSTNSGHVEKLFCDDMASMVLTDPPYNIDFKPPRGTHDKIKNDNMSEEKFNDFLAEVFTNCFTVLKDNTFLISFMGWSTTHNFRLALKDLFTIKSMPVWIKNNFGIGYYTRPQYEPFYLCLKGKPRKPRVAPSDVFEFSKVHKTSHSCEKPVQLLEELFKYFAPRKGIVFEPFLGSGSTLIAAEKTGRTCYGIELDEKYIDLVIQRWELFTGEKAILEETGEFYSNVKKN